MKIGIYVVIIIFLLCFVYSFHIATNPNIPIYLKKLNHSCVYGCNININKCSNSNKCSNIILPRGKSYIIEDIDYITKNKLDNCSFTSWNLSHYLMYTIVTALCPEFALHFFTLGVLFEGYEWAVYDCHDMMDIAANTAGIGTGLLISKAFNYKK